MTDLGTNINDHVKCKWSKYINQKTEIDSEFKNPNSNNILLLRESL